MSKELLIRSRAKLLELKPLTGYGVTGSRDVEQSRYQHQLNTLIDDLTAHIDAPEPEPVAYSVGNSLHWHTGKGVKNAQLYTLPAPAKPLTDEGILDIAVRHTVLFDDLAIGYQSHKIIEFSRAIEAAHGIGEVKP